ncbi:MAG: peptide chain release factor N(5)-glutamine methyltransferase [Deltaproteobacteria bacterium]|jgi:release factor glutamine methyltransferase|nr:peptide chain release factor N(5)-glutamine methyltransferase [Deltaproteobacteria bacterium]
MADKTWNVADILATTADFLAKKNPSSPRLEAELLLSEVLGLKRVQLYINFERILTTSEVDAYRELVRRRAAREPIAYILGRKEFYKLDLTVSPSTLIPRPETEHLVDEAIRILKRLNLAQAKVADIGCGSGAIALALASNLPQITVSAVDISAEALEVAEQNAKKHNLAERIRFFAGDLTEPLVGERFDVICANLPYIPHEEMANLAPDVALFEPKSALDGGVDGLEPIQKLLTNVTDFLSPQGHLLLEIWPSSIGKLQELAGRFGLNPQEPVLDYSKKPRIFVASIAPASS